MCWSLGVPLLRRNISKNQHLLHGFTVWTSSQHDVFWSLLVRLCTCCQEKVWFWRYMCRSFHRIASLRCLFSFCWCRDQSNLRKSIPHQVSPSLLVLVFAGTSKSYRSRWLPGGKPLASQDWINHVYLVSNKASTGFVESASWHLRERNPLSASFNESL